MITPRKSDRIDTWKKLNIECRGSLPNGKETKKIVKIKKN